MNDLIKRIRDALAEGPIPGEWIHLFGDRLVYTRLEDGCRGTPVVGVDFIGCGQDRLTLQFVAACNPVAVSALLDRLDAAERENERLREDADRYRWLRGDEDGRYLTVYAFRTDVDEVCLGEELDATIDAARRKK